HISLARLFSCSAAAPSSTSTLSLHDALPISLAHPVFRGRRRNAGERAIGRSGGRFEGTCEPQRQRSRGFDFQCQVGQDTHHQWLDRKSTRLNSSHQIISYAVFCLKKKNTTIT